MNILGGAVAVKMDWNVPQVEHLDINMVDHQYQASGGESWVPYLGFPQDWNRQAVVL